MLLHVPKFAQSSCCPSRCGLQFRFKLSPIRLPYDDLIQLVPGRQDLQFFRVYYLTSLLLSYKPPSFPTSSFLTLSLASSHPPPSHSPRFNISLPPST